jgi:hypothetical protein
VREHTVAIPETIGFQSVKMDDSGVCGPGQIVFEIVVQEVETIIRNYCDRFTFADRERVHDDLVGVGVDAVVDDALEMLEIVSNFVGHDLEPATLHREHARVDPVPRWFFRV